MLKRFKPGPHMVVTDHRTCLRLSFKEDFKAVKTSIAIISCERLIIDLSYNYTMRLIGYDSVQTR